MKEEKYIQSLFETARSEEPQLSFEEASETFEASLSPGVAASLKDWFLNHINLNSFIMMTTIGIIATVFVLNFQPKESQTIATPTFEEIPELVADSIVPVTVTVETQHEVVEISLKADPDKIRVTKTPIVEPIEISQAMETTSTAQNEIDLVSPITMNDTEVKPIEKTIENTEEATSIKTEKIKESHKPLDRGRKLPFQNRKLSELEVVLETALNLDHLKNDLFARSREGEYHQLIMRSNGKFDHLIDIQFAGKKVIIIANRHSEGYQIVGNEFVDVLKFKLGEEKAFFKFIYNSVIAEVRLMKVDGIWYFKSTNTDHQQPDFLIRSELLRNTFAHLRMDEIIERDENGNFKPFGLLSNGHFSPRVEVTFDDKDLQVVPNKYNRDYNRKIPHAEFTKFQIKRRKATIEFVYKGSLIIASYRKKNGAWMMRSFTHKKGNTTYRDINF